jgi:hypothetical protein
MVLSSVSAKSGPNVITSITASGYERRGHTRKSGKGFQHREKEAQFGFSMWIRLVFANKPLLKITECFLVSTELKLLIKFISARFR